VAKKIIKFIKKYNKETFYKLHKKTTNKILSFQFWRYAKILNLQQSIKTKMVIATFYALSNVLRSKSNIEDQYKLAQLAHNYK